MADYIGVLADLRARRSDIERERVELDTAIAAIERLAALAGVASAPEATKARDESRAAHPLPFRGMTMPQAVVKHFQAIGAGESPTTREVIDAVTKGGIPTKSSIRGHVYNTLHRLSQPDGPLQRRGEGRWGLRQRSGAHPSNEGKTSPLLA